MSDSFLSSKLIENISQKISTQKDKPGLYAVATPIGNIFDISFRAIHILRKSKIIFAEDTRNSRKLLDFYEIDSPLVACHEYNETLPQVVNQIHQNEYYSLISDAGTPCISDPGYRLINWCIEHNIDVFPIPGACAFISGLSVAGLPTDRFTFFGFPPNKKNAKCNFFEPLKRNTETLVFLESPKRILETLSIMMDVFGNRKCCACRELTKLFEDVRRGTIHEVLESFENKEPQGEFVLIVEGCNDIEDDIESAFDELQKLLQTMSVKESVSIIVDKYHLNKKQIYQKALEFKNE